MIGNRFDLERLDIARHRLVVVMESHGLMKHGETEYEMHHLMEYVIDRSLLQLFINMIVYLNHL